MKYDKLAHHRCFAAYITEKITELGEGGFFEVLDAVAQKWRESSEELSLFEYIGKYGVEYPGLITRDEFFAGAYHDPEVCLSQFWGDAQENWLSEHNWTVEDLTRFHWKQEHGYRDDDEIWVEAGVDPNVVPDMSLVKMKGTY